MARKRNTIGCLFYVALVLLVLVVFLFNRTRVQQVIEKTGFARLFQKRQAPIEVVVAPPATAPEGAPGGSSGAAPGAAGGSAPGSGPGGRPGSTPGPTPGSAPSGAPGAVSGNTPAAAPARRTPTDVIVELVKPSAGAQPDREVGARQPAGSGDRGAPPSRTRQARLFFIAVKPDGEIQLKSVIRPVKYADAPLTSTLESLLAGPTPAEINQGLMSLVAPTARLLRARVEDGTAYLDFSEDFRFNSLGKEGLSAQLEQVVYSATEFPTVKRVQILLEGRTEDYLGPEGLFIGKPLSRDSFQR
jgi:germination protein M